MKLHTTPSKEAVVAAKEIIECIERYFYSIETPEYETKQRIILIIDEAIEECLSKL